MRSIHCLTIALVITAASSAQALPPIPVYLQEALKGQDEYKDYAKSVAEAKDKCASCHIPGKDKKMKGHALNDFGSAMHKNLDDKAFMKAHMTGMNPAALALLAEAWTKTIDQKNADGETFAERAKAGKLPGKNE